MVDHDYEDLRKLGLNIAYYRKMKGFSQMELAEKINISRTHMSRIETAECSPSVELLFRLCRVLNIEPKNLFDFRDD